MKKLSLYIFLILMWCNVGFAECIKGDCINGYGTYTFESGVKYVGEFKNGIWNGQGTFTFADGKYVGEFKNGELHGQGTLTYTDGSKYVGEWKDNKKHGQGTYTGTDGGNYVGGFKNGRKYGQGTLTYANGTIDKGIWQDGKLKWQLDFDRAKILNGVWTINQPMDSFLNESKSGHNFVDEKIYIYKHWVGFVNNDHVCQMLYKELPFIVSRNSEKFGVKENSFVVLGTNCKDNEGRFGFDNFFIANKGSLVFFQYSTHFFFGPPWWTFSIDMIPEGQPNQFHNSFERDEVKFVKINKVGDMDEKKFFDKFKHKFKNLN